MSISLLGGRLKISLLLLPVAAGAVYFLGPSFFGAFTLSLLLHEGAHALMARAVGARIISMELLPFGCAANMEGFFDSGGKEAAVAMAGPLINIVTAAGMNLLFSGDAFAAQLVQCSAGLAMVNLLPALPMDGGRILAAALGLGLKRTTAVRIAGWLGAAVGMGVLMLGGYLLWTGEFNPTVLLTGGFMLYSSIKSVRSAGFAFARQSEEKRRALMRRTAVEVRHLAALDKRALGDVLLCMDPRKYNIVHVMDEKMRTVRAVDEGELLLRMLNEGAGAALGGTELTNTPKRV